MGGRIVFLNGVGGARLHRRRAVEADQHHLQIAGARSRFVTAMTSP